MAPSSPTYVTISYASVINPGTTLSVVSSLPSYIAPPNMTTPAGRTNNLIKQILSSNRSQQAVPPATKSYKVDGTFNHYINATNVHYDLSNHGTSTVMSFLMDGGANVGIPGSDICVISALDFHKANVTTIGETAINDLPLMTTDSFFNTHCGPATIFLPSVYSP